MRVWSRTGMPVIGLICLFAVFFPELGLLAEELVLAPISVSTTTPMHGIGTLPDEYPGNAQTATGDDMERMRAQTVSEVLDRRLGSVHINEVQNNAFQPDVSYRGLTASPLLGLPQGLAVYQQGVRVNEPFGDTVNWDMIPANAIADINLIPGSNPVFGMNALGGALSIQTKTGFTHPGTRLEAGGGSWGRRNVSAETGGQQGSVGYFLAGNWLDEDGWRAFSPSTLRQFFGSVGWRDGDTTAVDLDLTVVDNDLTGNGLLPRSTFQRDPDHVYTYPDETGNQLAGITLRGQHWLTDALQLSGNLYHRGVDRRTFNGDAELEAEFDNGDFEGFEVEGENRRSRTRIDTRGATLELTGFGSLAGRPNQLTVGLVHERSDTRFRVDEQEAELEETRRGRGTDPDGPWETEVKLDSGMTHSALYLTDNLDLSRDLTLTVSGRFNRTRVKLEDRSGENPDLDGRHTFQRFSPAAGLNFRATDTLGLFLSYSEGFRAPSPVELTCADENDPCPLPNAFVADPPLDPVIGRTWEVGARGRLGRAVRWTAALFRTDLKDDILFVQTATGATEGFFRNIDRTRRQGVELGISGELDRLRWFANYTYLDATYESDAELFNPVADPENPQPVGVRKGDRIPGIPRHIAKLGLDYAITQDWDLGTVLRFTGEQYLRGDEGNDSRPLGSYGVVDLWSRYRLAENVSVFGRVDNLFDRDYASFGAINRNAFSDPEGRVERFYAPGAPRAGWLGVEARF